MNNEEGKQDSTMPAGEHSLNRMLESMPDGFVALNRTWAYTYVNAQAERLLGVSRADVLHRGIWDCFPALIGTSISERLHDAMENGIITETEEFYAPLGVWLEVRAAPISGGLSIYFRDVSQRRRQEDALQESHKALRESGQALRQSEERYRALTEYCSDLVTILAPDGTILYDSPSVTNILGFGPDDRVGKNISDFLHPDEQAALYTIWENPQPNDPLSTRATHRFQHADGSWRWMESVGTLQIDNPAIQGIVINTRDISERKRLEEQFVQAGKLAALGELVAGVAHEINNPLSAISGHAQLLMLHSDPVVQQDGAVIQDMAQRMNRIVRSLRSFARKVGDGHAPRVPADMNQVVLSALEVIGSHLRSHDIEIIFSRADDIPPVVINEGEIEQVIINLLLNADQALEAVDPAQRRIHIVTSYQQTEQCRNTQQPCCFLDVTDSGAGIPLEIMTRIFEPFFTTKDVGEGTGLGLSIGHSIVVSHGGSLTAHNSRGRNGATFSIELPVETVTSPSN